MNKFSKLILILSIVILGVSALGVSCVQAEETNHIKVWVWNGTSYDDLCSDEECKNSIALFNEANFLPGDDPVTRQVKITNQDIPDDGYTGTAQKIGIEAIEVTNPDVNTAGDKFGDVLYLKIKEQGATDPIYESSLTTFFGAGEVTISNPTLANTASAIYDFSVEFNSDAGNDYQSASLGFSLIFGLQGTEIGPTPPPTPPAGPGGGGGIPLGLTIQYENSTTTDKTATITWLTSYKSTSRVVYSTTSGTFDFYAGEPNYGYEFCTDEKDNIPPISVNGVTYHTVVLSPLNPGDYYFRCISHASPATIGIEHSFTILAMGDTGAEGDAGDGDGSGDGAGDGDTGDGDTGDGGDAGDTGDSGDTGGAGDTGGDTSGTGDTGDTGDEGDTGAGGEDEFEYGDHIYEHKGDDDLLSIIDDEFGDEGDDDSKFLASIAAFFGDLEGWRLILIFLLWIILLLIILRLIKAWIDRKKNKQ